MGAVGAKGINVARLQRSGSKKTGAVVDFDAEVGESSSVAQKREAGLGIQLVIPNRVDVVHSTEGGFSTKFSLTRWKANIIRGNAFKLNTGLRDKTAGAEDIIGKVSELFWDWKINTFRDGRDLVNETTTDFIGGRNRTGTRTRTGDHRHGKC